MVIAFLFSTIYFLACFWFFPRISFLKNSGLTTRETRALLAFKIMAGLVAAFYFDKIFGYADYVGYNMEGIVQYKLLMADPGAFFTDFTNDIDTYGLGGLFESSYSFWAYLRFNLLYKFIAVLNLISGGNFYINSAIFSSLVFFGHIAFYRVYNGLYAGKKLWVLLCCFLLPSLMLYTSCPHKDGIVFLSLGIVSYIFYLLFQGKPVLNFKIILLLLLGFSVIFLFRNYLLLALLPAIITAWLCRVLSFKKRWIIGLSYLGYGISFFCCRYIFSSLDFPAILIRRKEDFMLVKEATTNISMNELAPTFQSFVASLPQALNHTLMRPYMWEFSNPAVILTAMELFFYQLIFVAFLVFGIKKKLSIHVFNVYGLCLFINVMLIIGYTIPNLGAIVRYRSIFWIFLLAPLVCSINWENLLFFKKQEKSL